MKLNTIKKSVIDETDYRFDAEFHLSDGRLHQRVICNNPNSNSTLRDVTERIFSGNIFKRLYVENSEVGYHYLTSSDMVKSDIETGKFISKKYTSQFKNLKIEKDWILLSCSGTLGNTVYTNSDFEKFVGTHDLIRIIPDTEKILSGYLYAFLSCKYGYSLLTQFSFGGVIKHIEPHHIENIPIPILPEETQQKIHNLIVESAQLRVEANKLLKEAVEIFDEFKIEYSAGSYVFNKVKIQKISSNKKRFDANYNVISELVDEKLKDFKYVTVRSQASKIFIGPRSKRNYVASGVPFLSTSEMQKANPTKTEKFVNHKTAKDFEIREGWLLTTRSGTLGDTVYALPCIDKYSVSEDAIRIVLNKNSEISNKYLFAFLKSNIGKNSLLSGSYGSVILHLNEDYVGDIKVPVFKEKFEKIEKKVSNYIEFFNKAIVNENQAIDLIEKEIDQWQQL